MARAERRERGGVVGEGRMAGGVMWVCVYRCWRSKGEERALGRWDGQGRGGGGRGG